MNETNENEYVGSVILSRETLEQMAEESSKFSRWAISAVQRGNIHGEKI